MASYSPEQIFALAQDNYAQCETIIKDISAALKANVNPDFDENVFLGMFDIIIQSCLLNAAVKDGELEHNEIVFLTNITKHADIIPFINEEMKKQYPDWPDLTWEIIPQLEAETQQNVGYASVAVVEPYAKAFVEIFATVDKILTEVDLLDELTQKVGILLVGLTGIDGDDIESGVATDEGSIAFATFNLLVTEKWKEITQGE
ncbi:MAG: hypothetical protein II980_02195 [Clostridia bacterium]|nr:hypothetical protein [Clostridia bacterium]